ncbi:hypothetical protein Asi03nite_00020 [Actinoplanes siamensis]|uniref:Uncharacterized protein n=1 Tax=Actinoplanes siamensis TaxID=1223317 RepID=A0A919K9G6_9ACTN|nr:hypothetical protein Asi03nite_00020 [Actinoplanes siamensis]
MIFCNSAVQGTFGLEPIPRVLMPSNPWWRKRAGPVLQRQHDGEGDCTEYRHGFADGEEERLAFEPIPGVRGVVRATDPRHQISVPHAGRVARPGNRGTTIV